jgi:hypothetical protein
MAESGNGAAIGTAVQDRDPDFGATHERRSRERPPSSVALEGDLAAFGAGEVLHWMNWAQATGKVGFSGPGESLELFLEGGRLLHARASGPGLRTGDVLLHRRQVSPEALATALAAQRDHGRRIGERLVADGASDPDAVRFAVEECVRRIVYRLLLWKEGRFRFEPDVYWESGALTVEMELEPLVLDGLRIADVVAAAV